MSRCTASWLEYEWIVQTSWLFFFLISKFIPDPWSMLQQITRLVVFTSAGHEWQREGDLRQQAELSEARRSSCQWPDRHRCFAWQVITSPLPIYSIISNSRRLTGTQWSWHSIAYRSDMDAVFRSCDEPCCSILHRLHLSRKFITAATCSSLGALGGWQPRSISPCFRQSVVYASDPCTERQTSSLIEFDKKTNKFLTDVEEPY